MAISISKDTKVTVPLLALVGLVGVGWTGYELNDRIAYKAYVEERVSGLEQNINELVAASVVAKEIDNYLRWKCENPGNGRFDGALARELDRYETLTGRKYDMTFKTCKDLLG